MEKANRRRRVLVVDTNALLHRLEHISKYVTNDDVPLELWTVAEVLTEVRDKHSRLFLQTLPWTIHTREPLLDDVRFTISFARQTGDLRALSKTDIKLMALTLTFEREVKGTIAHLRKKPPKQGARRRRRKRNNKTKQQTENGDAKLSINTQVEEPPIPPETHQVASTSEPASVDNEIEAALKHATESPVEAEIVHADDIEEDSADESETAATNVSAATSQTTLPSSPATPTTTLAASVSAVDGADDGGEWITPENFEKASARYCVQSEEAAPARIKVACATADFAMQNVLLQIGLPVVAHNSESLIKRIRRYVLKCGACFKIVKDVEKIFCPHCGHNSLERLAYTVDDRGRTRYHIKKHRKVNIRGTRYSLPLPTGGRHGNASQLVFTEDQLPVKKSDKKKRQQEAALAAKVFEPDYVWGADDIRNHRGPPEKIIVGMSKKNPNEAKRRVHKKKRHPKT